MNGIFPYLTRLCLGAMWVFVSLSSSSYAQEQNPVITPARDTDVTYELTSLLGDATSHQRMRWQTNSFRQRLDPLESKIFMITSWREGSLTVVDEGRRRFSVMPTPGSQSISEPGKPATQGTYIHFGHDMIAGEDCELWRTSDTDGHPVDVCYTADGILMGVWTEGRPTVRAMRVTRMQQPDNVFTVPSTYKRENPVKP